MRRMYAVVRTILAVAAVATIPACDASITFEGPDREPLEATGQVLSSADDLPISGASVRPCSIVGTQFGRWCGDVVQTDADGRFQIEESVHDSVCPVELRVSAAGFEPTERGLPACPGTIPPMTIILDPEGS